MSFQPPLSSRAFAPRTAELVAVPPRPGLRPPEPAPEEHVIRGPGLPGALARGLAIAALVMLPALVMPGIPPETAHLVVLLALFAATVTAYEYASPYPGLLEFRVGAPYNRTRYLVVGLSGLLLALLQRHGTDPGPLTGAVAEMAAVCGLLFAAAPSPVALLVAALPESVDAAQRALVRDGAALVLCLGAAVLLAFAIAIRLGAWPRGTRPFNVWVNLPTFEPTAGRDVVARLRRLSVLNLAAGLALPFLLPAVILASTILMQPVSLTSPLGYVWGIVLWAYIPVSLVMRGMAMRRVARLIEQRRARLDPVTIDPDA
jgi:hypothetical protein